MPCVCLANYSASEAFYPCIVVEKIHEYFRSKMRQYQLYQLQSNPPCVSIISSLYRAYFFEHFILKSSLYFEARIRIRIDLKMTSQKV
jgi:hypothetical protein